MAESAQDKLYALSERFSGFERQMEMETKTRKDAEELQLNALKDNVTRLEKTLNAEIKRRVEANKALQGMFEAQMATVQDKLEAGLLERLDHLHTTVGALNQRMDSVESDFSQSREKYIRDIEDKSAMVAKDVENLQAAFRAEREERKERETLIIAKLRDLEAKTVENFASGQALCEEKYQDIREELEEALNKDGDKKFQDFILEEIAGLKNSLVVESQTRESADDDIVNALNHYTKAIQESLRVVNQA